MFRFARGIRSDSGTEIRQKSGLASQVVADDRAKRGSQRADRGVKRARFVVIKQNVLPAILVEGGFVSNHMEAARVNRTDYRQSLALAIARGVIRFSNVMGDRHMQLPGGGPAPSSPAPAPPKAIAGMPLWMSSISSETKH